MTFKSLKFSWLENWKVLVLSIRVIKWNSWMPMSNFYGYCISNIPVDNSFIQLLNIYIIRIVFWVLNMIQIEYQTLNRVLCCLSIEISNFIHFKEKQFLVWRTGKFVMLFQLHFMLHHYLLCRHLHNISFASIFS